MVDFAEREERLFACLEAFLHAWADGEREMDRVEATSSATTAAAVAREDELLHNTSAHPRLVLHASGGDAASNATARVEAPSAPSYNYLTHFPPHLPSPLPRSFRPNEIMPGIYLGSQSDVGTNMLELAQRLRTVSTCTREAVSYPACRLWQRLVLLVRACPLKGIVAPRLELHVARRCDGKRRSRLPRAKITPAAAAMHSGQRPGAGMTAAPTDEDVVVIHMSLSEVYKRLCAMVAQMSVGAVLTAGLSRADVADSREGKVTHNFGSSTGASSSATSSGVSAIAKWLCPDSPLSSPSRSASPAREDAAYVPPGCTPADRHVFVNAMQCMLMEEVSAHIPAGAAPKEEEAHRHNNTGELRYWRLTLPITDSPATRIQHCIPMTNLIMHAALTLGEKQQGRVWLRGGPREGVSSSAPPSEGRAVVAVDGEGSASGNVQTSTAEATLFPCVAVHCQAGKSRSVAFVAAFLMEEWMWWYRGCYPLLTAVAGAFTAEQSRRQGGIARRLVDHILWHVRRRRLCIDMNVGFDTQLWGMMCGFLRSV
ncbi:hypothetical protein LSCM1_07576 [Leishmania martiniquensis]|uniref:Tyrosine specific protein phosphatases domain-containing protein n=1 Tax=Leishmania martiniquensis TaxID=1580590 RepID=A0A836H242_9TRYP|nr:hypothetical protein LSCM1_07576 [Leishmania martiniquensis]